MLEAKNSSSYSFNDLNSFNVLGQIKEEQCFQVDQLRLRFACFLSSLQLNHDFSYDCLSKLLDIPADNLKSPYSLTIRELIKVEDLMNLIKQ